MEDRAKVSGLGAARGGHGRATATGEDGTKTAGTRTSVGLRDTGQSAVIQLSSHSISRSSRSFPAGHSFHITLRCNSRQFLIAKRIRRDVLLVVLEKAKQDYSFRLYGICLMMHWVGWCASMLLNRLSGRCGHFWEAR